jgi:DDE superfamily endonuclease
MVKRYCNRLDERTALQPRKAPGKKVDELYPEAQRIVLMMDNLNTHTPASPYEAFESTQEARRLTEKLEVHYTSKHGSWLNIAEIELSVLSRRCLDPRVPDFEALQAEVAAWQEQRDETGSEIEWRLRTEGMFAPGSSDSILHYRSNSALRSR